MTGYKVLVPLDGSRTAEHSLVYLAALKRFDGCAVELLCVADEAEDFHGKASGEALEREANLLSTYLREVAHDVEEHVGVQVEMKVVRGNPAQRVAEEIVARKPDLLVISTHGRSGVSRWRIGSVADKVIRAASCNTLIVGPHAHQDEVWIDAGAEEPFKKILVPLDGSALAENALGVARQYAETFGSTLHLVRVVNFMYGGTFTPDGAYSPDLFQALEEGAAATVAEAAQKLGAGVCTETATLMGDPAAQLEGYVKAKDIDLVVMTTHGRSGFTRTALGSVTDRMLANGTAPVLVVRAG
jgi:nucleotide-binding universal stress UspA family protein